MHSADRQTGTPLLAQLHQGEHLLKRPHDCWRREGFSGLRQQFSCHIDKRHQPRKKPARESETMGSDDISPVNAAALAEKMRIGELCATAPNFQLGLTVSAGQNARFDTVSATSRGKE